MEPHVDGDVLEPVRARQRLELSLEHDERPRAAPAAAVVVMHDGSQPAPDARAGLAAGDVFTLHLPRNS